MLLKHLVNVPQAQKKIIRWAAFLTALGIFIYQFETGGAVYEAYITGTGRPLAMQAEIERDKVLDPILFFFICVFYATYTNHIIWLTLIVAAFYFCPPCKATGYFTVLLFLEIIEKVIYKPVSKAVVNIVDKRKKLPLLVLKYFLKISGKAITIGTVFLIINSFFADHVKECGWVPFPKFFSALNYKGCGEIVNVTLKSDSPRYKDSIKFAIPSEYLESPWHDGKIDKIKILLAYPTFEPWYKAKAQHPQLIDEDPIEIEVEIRSFYEKVSPDPDGNMSFKQDKYELLEYNFSDLEPNARYYASSYYYPKEKDYPIDYLSCPSLNLPRNVACDADAYYSTHLHGRYLFRHKDIANWQEIDFQVRKLLASFIQPPHVEKFHLINHGEDIWPKKPQD